MANRTAPARAKNKLVDQLAKQIGGPETLNEPFILQDRIAQTRTRHVVVIWDGWTELKPVERSNIILNAYAKAAALDGDSIAVATGLTQQQAMQLGYLPYSIIILPKSTDPISLPQLRRALERVGGVQVRTGSLLQVRFPTPDLAQEAYRQLIATVPGPYWAIQHETTASDSH